MTTDNYGDTLAEGVSLVLAQDRATIRALYAVCRNLAAVLELNDLNGKTSLAQQLAAHHLSPTPPEN